MAAFAVLYERHAGSVFGLAYRIVRDHAAAEDVTQEAFVQLWRHRQAYAAERGAPRAWLMTIARNRAVDSLRGTPVALSRSTASTSPGRPRNARRTRRCARRGGHARRAQPLRDQRHGVEPSTSAADPAEIAGNRACSRHDQEPHAPRSAQPRTRPVAAATLSACSPQRHRPSQPRILDLSTPDSGWPPACAMAGAVRATTEPTTS